MRQPPDMSCGGAGRRRRVSGFERLRGTAGARVRRCAAGTSTCTCTSTTTPPPPTPTPHHTHTTTPQHTLAQPITTTPHHHHSHTTTTTHLGLARHHVLLKAQAVQQLGGLGLKGGGVQLIQALIDRLQALILWAIL
jgi:hypothetical protein